MVWNAGRQADVRGATWEQKLLESHSPAPFWSRLIISSASAVVERGVKERLPPADEGCLPAQSVSAEMLRKIYSQPQASRRSAWLKGARQRAGCQISGPTRNVLRWRRKF